MAVLAEQVDELRSDATGAADDDDLHGLTTFVLCRSLAPGPRSRPDSAVARDTWGQPSRRVCHRSPPSPVLIVATSPTFEEHLS